MIDFRNIRSRFGRRVDLVQQISGYRAVPDTVIADLMEFCGAVDEAPKSGDPFIQGRAAGRRDVWLRIQHHRHLREHELYALMKGEPLTKPERS
jgi:hypothetical protein